MLDQLAQINMSIYFQTVVFIALMALVTRLHWKIGSVPHLLLCAVKY